MKAVLQRVERAQVSVGGEVTGRCGHGLLILLGVAEGDTSADAEALAAKIAKCRIFSDDVGKMNLSLLDVSGGALVVSNFTLNANWAHGNRPDYLASAKPETAKALYMYFTRMLEGCGVPCECGVFGADMKIDMLCDGPVTIVMDSTALTAGRNGGK